MGIQIVTAICLAILVLELLTALVYGLLQKRPQRIAFIRSFKKGKCALIYLTTIPLYFIGHIYAGQDVLKAFFTAVPKTINLVVLQYDTGTIEGLMAHSGLYKFTVYFAFLLVGINALLFTVSLTSQYIWCAIEAGKAMLTPRDKLYLLGNNPDNITIYKSDKTHSKAIVDNMDDRAREQLFSEELTFIDTSSFSLFLKRVFARMKINGKTYTLVVNTGNDEENMTVCRGVIDHILLTENKEKLFLQLRVFVFGDPLFASIYEDIVSAGYGCIHYVNKYQKIAVDFVDKYPLARFMDETQIDYETSLVREGVDINVLLVGFGRTNQQVFLTSVANNQFLTGGDGGAVLKPVRYHIFDKDTAEHNKNLNHSYYRFRQECTDADRDAYLPLPAQPAEEIYYRMDINHSDFYRRVRDVVTKNKTDANFVVIGFGTDLENIDMAQKLLEKRKEWGADNLVIFVKVRAFHQTQTTLEEAGCYLIGCEKDIIFDIEKILSDKMTQMAKLRNQVYDLEYTLTHESGVTVDEAYLEAHQQRSNRNWYMTKSQMERESSIYCCLSLRSKLLLMGLDYADKNDPRPAIGEEAYLSIYAGDDRPVISQAFEDKGLKPVVAYTLDFRSSRRKTMAIHEHERWNSFMISRGMIPSTVDQIKNEKRADGRYTNGKNYAVRRHGNLTTFEGLVTFRRLVAARSQTSEAEADVIKYDYQLLDDAYWLLNQCGYKIVKKQN